MERIGDVAERAVRTPRGARGRQDRSGQEKVIDKTKLVEKLPYLVKLHTSAKDAAKDLSDGIKKVAEQSGLLASVVRKIVVAKAGENFEEKKKEAEQLALMFDEVKG